MISEVLQVLNNANVNVASLNVTRAGAGQVTLTAHSNSQLILLLSLLWLHIVSCIIFYKFSSSNSCLFIFSQLPTPSPIFSSSIRRTRAWWVSWHWTMTYLQMLWPLCAHSLIYRTLPRSSFDRALYAHFNSLNLPCLTSLLSSTVPSNVHEDRRAESHQIHLFLASYCNMYFSVDKVHS